MTTRQAAVAALRATVERVLAPLLYGRAVTALVDFPNYGNVGDSAIYLGQLACLDALRISRPRFICDFRTYDRDALRDAAGDGVILLTGGGSFGDLWPTGQQNREEILRAFPDNAIVQLPQTLHFGRREALDRARRAVDGHGRVTLLWRDERSLEAAQREFSATSFLCPDMAFCLGPIASERSGARGVVWLSRTDQELAHPAPDDAGVRMVDWVDEPMTALLRLNYGLMGATMRLRPSRWWRGLLMRTYQPLARQRLGRGMRLLGSGSVVVTDRLHGHILSMLLDIPHVLLDNSYGKLSSFHSTWTQDVDGVQLASSAGEALELAMELAVGERAQRRGAQSSA